MDECLFTNFYKKCYKDINNLNDLDAQKHWETVGKAQGRLSNSLMFKKIYPDFNYNQWIINNPEYKFNSKYEVYGWVFIKDKTEYQDFLRTNSFIINPKVKNNTDLIKNNEQNHSKPVRTIQTDKVVEYNKIVNDNETNKANQFIQSIPVNPNNLINFQEFINQNKITHINVSLSLEHFKDRFIKKFNIKLYDKNKDYMKNTIFFGLYDLYDFKRILKHTGKKYIMWGGTDCDDRFKLRKNSIQIVKKISNLTHISISESIKNRLDKNDIISTRIYFNLVDKTIFNPISEFGECIYIYNGYTKGNEYLYGEKIYKKLMEKLPQYTYILSNELSIPWEEMPNVYKKCFVGLRLTEEDGNANTVQEFNSMGIPIIFNGEGGIPWSDLISIGNTIKILSTKPFDKNILTPFQNQNSFYNFYTDYTDKNLDLGNIYSNIDMFVNFVKNYKNILLLCSDYPGYGGAATNSYNIYKHLIKLGINIEIIYYVNPEEISDDIFKKINIQDKNISNDDLFKINIVNYYELKDFLMKNYITPDLIILKSHINQFNIKEIFNSTIVYLVPGIYTNELNKYYFELKSLEENKKYINKSVITQIHNSDIVFTNSIHTKELLLKYYNINTYQFYSSFINFYGQKILQDKDFSNRKYNYAIIVSNFDRKIKNIVNTLRILKDEEKVLLIGKNSYKFSKKNFETYELVDNVRVTEFLKNTKYLISNSYFESCSNVVVEAIFSGCKIITHNEINNITTMKKWDNIINESSELIESNEYNKSNNIEITETIEDFLVNNQSLEILAHNNILIRYVKKIKNIDEILSDTELENYKILKMSENNLITILLFDIIELTHNDSTNLDIYCKKNNIIILQIKDFSLNNHINEIINQKEYIYTDNFKIPLLLKNYYKLNNYVFIYSQKNNNIPINNFIDLLYNFYIKRELYLYNTTISVYNKVLSFNIKDEINIKNIDNIKNFKYVKYLFESNILNQIYYLENI